MIVRLEPTAAWPRSQQAPRVLTGDLRFDGRIAAFGSPDLVLAYLSTSMREMLLAMFRGKSVARVSLGPNHFFVERPSVPERRAPPWLAEVARRFPGTPRAVTAALLNRALLDRDRRVRALAFDRLVARLPTERDFTRRAVLARLARSDRVRPRQRVDALDALARLGDATVAVTFERALTARCPEVVDAAMRHLGRYGRASAVPTLQEMARTRPLAEAVRAVEAIGNLPAPVAEPALVALLADVDHGELEDAVVRALSRVGKRASLPVLSAVAVGAPRALAASAKEARRAIAARAGLSGGEVSPAEATGALALVRRDRGH